ncbi:unnamed protein product, partial [Prorocentrum cordatum]
QRLGVSRGVVGTRPRGGGDFCVGPRAQKLRTCAHRSGHHGQQSPSAVVQPGIAPSASPAGAARDRAGGVAGASSQSSAPVGCFSGLRAKVRRRPATRAPRPRTAGRMPPESGPRLARGPGRSRSVLGLPLECQPAADQSSVRDAFVHP